MLYVANDADESFIITMNCILYTYMCDCMCVCVCPCGGHTHRQAMECEAVIAPFSVL